MGTTQENLCNHGVTLMSLWLAMQPNTLYIQDAYGWLLERLETPFFLAILGEGSQKLFGWRLGAQISRSERSVLGKITL